jgi:8-oxo-dGTP pyrophosphatase MutT (NUDIX family)
MKKEIVKITGTCLKMESGNHIYYHSFPTTAAGASGGRDPPYTNTHSHPHRAKRNYHTRRIQCINCGVYGHTARKCAEPVTSYGIICCKLTHGNNGEVIPHYLMIQRRDSLGFIEFIRGRYDLCNKDYLLKLFTCMTNDEKEHIKTHDFETIWEQLWKEKIVYLQKHTTTYCDSKHKFDLLKRGVYLKDALGNSYFQTMDTLINHSKTLYDETEWEFPKGRRHLNENDLECAVREFDEETGIAASSIYLLPDHKSYEEIYSGINSTRYRSVYFLAMVNDATDFNIKKDDPNQYCEVRSMEWLPIEGVLNKIRDMYVERKQLIQHVHRVICEYAQIGVVNR